MDSYKNGKRLNGTSSSDMLGRRGSTQQLQKGHQKTVSHSAVRAVKDTTKEKPPSKDGSAQKAAGAVAGLKDYVRIPHTLFKSKDNGWSSQDISSQCQTRVMFGQDLDLSRNDTLL